MNRSEINPDEAIDRVLGGLRDAEVPQGMEGRILARLENRTVAPRRWLFTAPQAWTFATAGFALAALALAWATTHHAHHAVTERAVASSYLAPKVQDVQEARSAPIRMKKPQAYNSVVPTKLDPKPSEPATETSEDTIALSDLHAPSQPAPPLPLTEQEKLLISMVRRGDPVELAMLDPKFRSSEEADSRADFDRFFAPPPPPKPLPTDTKLITGDKK